MPRTMVFYPRARIVAVVTVKPTVVDSHWRLVLAKMFLSVLNNGILIGAACALLVISKHVMVHLGSHMHSSIVLALILALHSFRVGHLHLIAVITGPTPSLTLRRVGSIRIP